MTVNNLVLALVCTSLIGCSSTRALHGDAADWQSTLNAGDRVTVVGTSGQKVAVRYETIDDGVLYGTLYDDTGSAFTIPLEEIDKLEIERSGGAAGTGKTLAIVGLVVLGVALIDALQNIPPGWPAYQ